MSCKTNIFESFSEVARYIWVCSSWFHYRDVFESSPSVPPTSSCSLPVPQSSPLWSQMISNLLRLIWCRIHSVMEKPNFSHWIRQHIIWQLFQQRKSPSRGGKSWLAINPIRGRITVYFTAGKLTTAVIVRDAFLSRTERLHSSHPQISSSISPFWHLIDFCAIR